MDIFNGSRTARHLPGVPLAQEEQLRQQPEIEPFLESVAAAQGWAEKEECCKKVWSHGR